METVLTTSPPLAAQFIRRGEVVAFPTETVYGLGANVFDEAAIRKIFQAKGRPTDNPLIAHVANLAQLQTLTTHLPANAAQLIAAFFPGPLTLVLPKHPDVSLLATAGLPTIGVRMPRHALALEFITACGVPLVAPSANLSGRPSPTTWQAVQADLDGRIACILQGEQAEVGLESTVVDCTGNAPVVLRAGALTLEQLQTVLPASRLASQHDVAVPKSPGLKYRHYSPQARVVLIDNVAGLSASLAAAFIGLNAPPRRDEFRCLKLCANVAEYAHEVFSFFRVCDAAGVREIYCEVVEERGLGLALMDRLKRAAQNVAPA
ncbi:MAG: threonylcarbamoyl-AMP synthase [Acidobacteria bacterium]|nr:threonylcarbamoyl-AMP synthase [Acidobacteriota bacterium]MBI3422075.1 threonylcarbamoyl-AMP synthase [Acidobacteriota bacterium]